MTVKVRELPKGSGKWYVKVDWHQRRVSRLFPSEERAREVAGKLATALDLYGMEALKMFQRPEPPRSRTHTPTVREFAERWQAELEKRDLKRATRLSYVSNLKHHIIPALGDRLLTEIDYAVLKEFVCAKVESQYSTARFRKPPSEGRPERRTPGIERRYSRDTVRLMVQTLRAMMSEAVLEGLIPSNPVVKLAPFYRKHRQDRTVGRGDVYTPEELYSIEDVLRTRRALFGPDMYELTLCMSRTGMRVGEALGLKPEDLDFRARTIEIQRNIPSGHGGLEGSTKGRVGRRVVDMGRDLYEALEAMLARRRIEQLKSGKPGEQSPWLFHAPGGGHVQYKTVYDDWVRAQRIAGVRARSPHALRHTYASVSLARGEDLAYVSRQLGHANPEITLAIYTHFLPRRQSRDRNALDRTAASDLRENPQVIRK
jgi:integrase